MLKEITQTEYETLDITAPTLVEFYSKTCGPCKMLGFVLKEIEKSLPDFPMYQIDFDANIELKERLGVKGFPTILLYKDGAEVERLEGLKQKPVVQKAIENLF